MSSRALIPGMLAILAVASRAQLQVAHPPEMAAHEGNSQASYYYYGSWWYTTSSTISRPYRLQSIFDFPSSVAGALNSVTFRRDSSIYPGTMSPSFWVDLEVRCSTSPVTSSTSSTTFANNIGNDQVTVIARKKINIASRPYIGSFPEPFLISFAFDKKFVYLASKGSLCVEVRHYNNSLYDPVKRQYNYFYADGFFHYSTPTGSLYGAYLEGPSSKCFSTFAWEQWPMRTYFYNYLNRTTTPNQLYNYWYGYYLERNMPAVLFASLKKAAKGIPLHCGTLDLDLTTLLFVLPVFPDSMRGYFRFPASGYLQIPYDPKTMGKLRMYAQTVSLNKKGELKTTNWYMRSMPVLPSSGNRFPQDHIYRNGSTAFTSTTGFKSSINYSRGVVLRFNF